MKAGIGMIINCDDCKARYEIPNNKIDDYNIYYVPNPKTTTGFMPKLLCPSCTKKWRRAI